MLHKKQLSFSLFYITSFYGHLPRYHWRTASIVSQIVLILINRKLSDGSVNWPRVRRRGRQNIQ